MAARGGAVDWLLYLVTPALRTQSGLGWTYNTCLVVVWLGTERTWPLECGPGENASVY